MTSKTSLFNFGIYINILKRFKWGSFLYAVILFFSTPFVFLMQNPVRLAARPIMNNIPSGQIILLSNHIAIPFLLALIVPTIAAILTWGSVHSVKQGIFTHSLPVKRSTNYVSSLLGGATLMAAPVLINAFILVLMSIFGYGKAISLWSIFVWTAVQGAVIFIMYSVAVLSGFLTGHKVAHPIINIVLHTFSLLVALSIYLISTVFLYGFVESESFIATRIALNTPLVWLFGQLAGSRLVGADMFKTLNLWLYILGAAILYGLSCYLYTKRKIEACGEVAAFKIFRPILKYTLTVAAAVCALGIMWASGLGAAATFIVAIVISAIVYFACEMLLSKTVKVFGKYKGYCIFAFSMAIVICFCAFTSVFGYETRIPEKSDVAKASVFVGHYGVDAHPLVSDPDAIDAVVDFHREVISYIPLTRRSLEYINTPYTDHIYITYELKNGKTLDRYYSVTNEMLYQILSKMYEYPEYKLRTTGIDMLNTENVHNLNLSMSASGHHYDISLNEDSAEFMKAVKSDIEALSYDELCDYQHGIELNINISLSKEENDLIKVFADNAYSPNAELYEMNSFNYGINSHFTNSIAFLKERGYYDTFINSIVPTLQICKLPVDKTAEENEVTYSEYSDIIVYKEAKGIPGEFRVNPEDCVQLSAEDALMLAELMFETQYPDLKVGKNYLIFARSNDFNDDFWLTNKAFSFAEGELPEYLRKYVE